MKRLLLLPAALTAALTLSVLAAGKTPPPAAGSSLPAPTPTPPAMPGNAERLKELTDRIEKLKKAKAQIEQETKDREKSKAANEQELQDVVLKVAPLAQAADEGLAKLEELKGKFEQHGARCHAGQLEQGAYNDCVSEHKQIENAFTAQQRPLEELDKQMEPYRVRFETLQKEHEAHEQRLKVLQEEMARVEEKLANYLALRKKLTDCNDPAKSLEAISQCGQVAWDGARAIDNELPADPRKPFVATEGDAVDARDVPKMSEEERRQKQNAPAVQRPRVFKQNSTPPPSPSKP